MPHSLVPDVLRGHLIFAERRFERVLDPVGASRRRKWAIDVRRSVAI